MVVDALDLCYTKDHIDTFVVISGDSDFSPLVSKLRENAKLVIGVGVKNSTSDLLMNNCDEFLFYDDLVRAKDSTRSRRRQPATKKPVDKKKSSKKSSKKNKAKSAAEPVSELDQQEEAIDLVLETAEGLFAEQGDRVWGSMIKQTLKRRRPGFNESNYGFRSFSDLLEAVADRGFLKIEMDERSGGYVILAIQRDD